MEPDYWLSRWEERDIGFHQDCPNPLLTTLFSRLEPKKGAGVLVPLCGKSLDLWWLREQGLKVCGIEVSDIAVREFFSDGAVAPVVQKLGGGGERCRISNLTLFRTDFFSLRASELNEHSPMEWLYDRASLIALPPEKRKKYLQKLLELAPNLCGGLMLTVQYPSGEMHGPPFSVGQEEIEAGLGRDFQVECVHREDVLHRREKYRDSGLSRMVECAYLVARKGIG